MWEMLLVLGLAGTAGFFVLKENRLNFQRNRALLRDSGFRESARLVAREGVLILFDDRNRQIAFVSHTMSEQLPYEQISNWFAETKPDLPADFNIHTLNVRCPLFTFRIKEGDKHLFVATMTAHINGTHD